MKRIGIVSDVHADVAALRDALASMRRLGCDLVVCCGDIVDEGSAPEETIGCLRTAGVICIRGNHDRWAVERKAMVRADGVRVQLSEDALVWLAGLPPTHDLTLEETRVAVRHGTPRSDMDGIYPDQAGATDVARWLDQSDADVLVVGHTHVPLEISSAGNRRIVNPGALLREVRGSAAAPALGTFGVLTLPSRGFRVFSAASGLEMEIARRWYG